MLFGFRIGRASLDKKIFENNGYIHVNSPGAGADNTLGSDFYTKI